MKINYIIILLLISGCTTFQYTKTSEKVYPEIGTIGVFEKYVFQKINNPKTILKIDTPIRLDIQNIEIKKINFFKNKDSLTRKKKDSILVKLKVVDELSLVQQINKNKELLNYLKRTNDNTVVTEVTINYPNVILSKLKNADELYLVQNKEKTLSIQLRKNNKILDPIEFSSGKIVNYKVSNFCWGSSSKYGKVKIISLTGNNTRCNADTYNSPKRAERKTKVKF